MSAVGRTGVSAAELAVAMSVIGLLCVLALPTFIDFHHASALRRAADDVVALLQQARQLGIRENRGACVHIGPAAVQYRLGTSCTAAAVVGAGTDAGGNRPVHPGVTLSSSADPVFNHLGSASPGATITLTNAQTGRALRVIVAVSGRVRISP